MKEITELLSVLCAPVGVSGAEEDIVETISVLAAPFGEVKKDALHSVSVTFGEGDVHLMLEAHCDRIGLIVTDIGEDGFLKIAPCGGSDARILPGSRVTVFGREPVTGIICSLPPHLREHGDDQFTAINKLSVDVGLSADEAKKLISPGDRIIVPASLQTLLGNRISGSALDDRSGCAVLLRCLQLLKDKAPKIKVTALFSSREEVGGQGAQTAAFRESPDECIAVDVSFASQPGAEELTCELSKGPMLGIAPTLDSSMFRSLKAICEKEAIPYQLEVMDGRTGTDADDIGTTKAGIPCALLSLPQRYMHTPAECMDPEDLENTARLLCAYTLERGCI